MKKQNIDKLEKIQEEFNYQNAVIIKCESKLNEINEHIKNLKKNIKDLENKKSEIDQLKKINSEYNKKIQEINKKNFKMKIDQDENNKKNTRTRRKIKKK